MNKNIGAPGYVGEYVAIEFQNGNTRLIEGDATDSDCAYYGESYDALRVRGYRKDEPYCSPELIGEWSNQIFSSQRKKR